MTKTIEPLFPTLQQEAPAETGKRIRAYQDAGGKVLSIVHYLKGMSIWGKPVPEIVSLFNYFQSALEQTQEQEIETLYKQRLEDGRAYHLLILQEALKTHCYALAEHLAVNDYDINQGDAVTGVTLLHLFSDDGNEDAVRWLLSHKARVDAKNISKEETPLHMAACAGRIGVATLLLDAHAAIDAPTTEKSTPLHYAACQDKPSMLELLIKRGANVDATAVQLAERMGLQGNVAALLQEENSYV